MNWCFAIINNKLAEVYFKRKGTNVTFIGHCYVDAAEYKTQSEQKAIKEDITKVRLRYSKGKYNPIKH
ncbi:MAG: hypothetical protein ACD_36C00134G0002 [uncultured bacterium]|uniref:Uncharacterized protein n=1 Tax=Candidatus Gottesmanbacteria bacterium RIFCSPLOWO2_01_FULL_43_11b TaxID=1798392 RepID=A0A1F6AHR4_9BACT|nr:MAG: hypothetical protein ACD_36C00134G0002 [uncultured bacterium]OGG24264.1 MAG: hypothetical protein A3A79_03695 [Candidatus Gottesmanbacteria bacterium RIFCSPLOWO2_01_FULL_43_11b]